MPNDLAEHTFDNGQTIDQVADSLSGDLGLGEGDDAGAESRVSSLEPAPKPELDPKPQGEIQQKAAIDPNAPKPREVPKSWPKEAHDYWGKLDPKVQELVEKREADFNNGIEQFKGDAGFARQLKDVIRPYEALLTAQGITDHAQGIKGLLNAHYQLSNQDENARTAYLAHLMKGYRIDPAKLAALAGQSTAEMDPNLKQLKDQVDNLTGQLTNEQQQRIEAERSRVQKEVEAFASDPAHPYFEEVATHISLLLRDPSISLSDAYEQAVWANPATRAKEQGRIQKEAEEKLRKEVGEAAAKARKAMGTNVQSGRDGGQSPEKVGTMEDTMRDTLKDIRNRVAET